MRPTRKTLKFDEDSVNKLLQELYNESHNIKAKIIRLYNKWEVQVKNQGEVAAIGDQIIKLIAAEAKNQDQKILLLKFLKEVVYDNKAGIANKRVQIEVDPNTDENGNVSTDRRNELLKMVEDELEKKDNNKKHK